MSRIYKYLEHMRRNPNNVRFSTLCLICDHYFGRPRQNGTSHRVYEKPWAGDPRINIQNCRGKVNHIRSNRSWMQSRSWVNGKMEIADRYTYRVFWSDEDNEYVATVAEMPSISWLEPTQTGALEGLRKVVGDVIADMEANNEPIPAPFRDRHYSGKFLVRIPPELHCQLAIEAAEEHVSLNRLVASRLASTR